jgi:hypothetical protein
MFGSGLTDAIYIIRRPVLSEFTSASQRSTGSASLALAIRWLAAKEVGRHIN